MIALSKMAPSMSPEESILDCDIPTQRLGSELTILYNCTYDAEIRKARDRPHKVRVQQLPNVRCATAPQLVVKKFTVQVCLSGHISLIQVQGFYVS